MTVLYRKWRPTRFASVVGQRVIVRTLRNAVASGRLAHAYLFEGPRGTGKTTMGRLVAKAANCTAFTEGEACGACLSCRAFSAGRALDLVEIDAASNRGIEDIRGLRARAAYRSTERYKVYLIDEVHMLTEAAFNALLKMLEEPPPHVIFILATTEAYKLPATVVSRCQRFSFRTIQQADIVKRLRWVASREGITLSRAAAHTIAVAARGSVRDALSILDQVCDSCGKAPTLAMVQECLDLVTDPRATLLATYAVVGNLPDALKVIAELNDEGANLLRIRRQVLQRLQHLLGKRRNPAQVVRALRVLSEDSHLYDDSLSTLPLELALARLSLPADDSERVLDIGIASRTAVSADRDRVEKAGRTVAKFITERGYAEAFAVAQQIGIEYGLQLEAVDEDQDRLRIRLNDLSLVSFAAALRAVSRDGTRAKQKRGA